MTQMTPPKIRPKSYTYNTQTTWLERRLGTLQSEGKPDLKVGSPPEFKGEPGVWTPEDMLVAAVESCTMNTFLALADRAGISVISYKSRAEGTLEFVENGFQFTKVSVHPEITVAAGTDRDQLEKLVEKTHQACLISRSLSAQVTLEPQLSIGT